MPDRKIVLLDLEAKNSTFEGKRSIFQLFDLVP